MLFPMLNVLYFYISILRNMCAVPNMAVFCSSLWFRAFPVCCSGIWSMILTLFYIIIVLPHVLTGQLRRWADKFCLHCNIFIYIRQIWTKPVLCSRMVSLFHHTSPWTHRCLQASPSAHRNWRVFRRSVQTACCYWILNHGKNSSNWNS